MLRTSRIVAASLAAAAVIGLTLGIAVPAQAAGRYPTLANANVRSAPTTSSPIVTVLTKGTSVNIDCYANGQSVSGTVIWDRIPGMGYISDSLLLTGKDNVAVVPPCPGATYNRTNAVNWALAHVHDTQMFNDDCTWFASNVLWAGGLPQGGNWTSMSTNPGDWASRIKPGPSKASALADAFKNAVLDRGYGTIKQIFNNDRSAGGAQLGDVILYDWNGNKGDGFVDHAAVVTKINPDGTVGISQHSPARDYRQWNLDENGKMLPSSDGFYLLHITY